MMDWNGAGAVGWVVMTMLMLIFWAAVIGIGYVLLRAAAVRNQPSARNESGGQDHAAPPVPATDVSDALRVLDVRLASGELDPDDYQRRRALLTGNSER
jgi:uncharacterized membrane protein